MSGQGGNESGTSGGELQFEHEIINHKTRGSQQKEHQESKEEVEEMLRQDEEATQQAKWTDQTLPFITAARMAGELGIHTPYIWGIAMTVMLATGVQVQDSSMLWDNSGPP